MCCWMIWLSLLVLVVFLLLTLTERAYSALIETLFAYSDVVVSESAGDISVSAGDMSVEICVYDYVCEDGDKVRVSLNSRQIFSGELSSEEVCVSAEVIPGANEIKMFAINGTSGKGFCPSNLNTGVTRIGNSGGWWWPLLPQTEALATVQVRVR